VKRRRDLVPAAVLAAAAVGFSIGKVATTPSAEASAAHRYTIRIGDTVTIPAVNQQCTVYRDNVDPRYGGTQLYCARPDHARHQVRIFRSRILIWKVGNSNSPVWSGKP
jgi:hypothetical protein